ncbi:tRNA (cytosine(32)/uridine(32)-2'-O)-methyltransferase TrmJ [Halomonas sp. MCCC 1A17488]|uniref:tRNA (cytidine/uridine-2'-O-)-methyltransferase TrmJ n=1 Tax=Billgrantia sulfidoxydans TaxID=2733484 RepID=A0ABX7W9C5_9GAMM|nr:MULTISPECIES: tRNA (cytosine(32)/uridine(32)-2'-O)-methyltransferase TrmJ [Halomonas]MCE8017818.1 tRNA (cytosine(32)/uridine(32)-2'-O)-methyltransferase TrmJ [Halomonas sp. MCCC 1A17488]MCG3241151.1 tRNA (cytosine(32)/uridine(32)-2'-O)-methyltransferase TrmJ [Halomonas sp. MCCC 1A17488]QPP49005.1 tRNA (cytosine(32)/uridine(32)-2'-O)-methyltransferase TrmJ [Halomonas sp. SS10-MC5]QTP56342.1 tRNA (cytosine(32)/uridine(32)-2'-O)-methyltransferase TrmJ [Halomonas sulfidoxydans]
MLDRIRIVLIGTSHPGNIGATARAMHNMGLADLALVAPRCEPLTSESISRASGADHIVHAARVVDTLEEAVADCTLAVGASARSRTLPWPMITPRELGERLPRELAGPGSRLALVFGREDSGLSNAELQRCHAHVHIPTNPEFSSLNLAAAVQVLAYECRLASLEADGDAAGEDDEPQQPLASHAELEHYFAHLERTLVTIGFHDPATPRQLMARLRRFTLRARPERMELNILRGILSATEKGAATPAADRIEANAEEQTCRHGGADDGASRSGPER